MAQRQSDTVHGGAMTMRHLFLPVMAAFIWRVPLLAEGAWSFLPGGNGDAWRLPESAEVRWTDPGLYLHGRVSDGMKMVFSDGLDAGANPYLNYCISTAEYTSAS